MHGARPHAPTFRLFDRTCGAEPMACDCVLVSDALAPQVKGITVDLRTQAYDHQPVSIELA